MEKCCWIFCRLLLIAINLLAMFAFLAIVAVAVFAFSYIYGKDYDIEDFPSLWENPNESNNQFLIGMLIIIGLFTLLAIFACCGCCGACVKNNCMLGTFIVILIIFLSGNVTGIVFLYKDFGGEVKLLKETLKLSIKENMGIEYWDQFQKTLACCGVDSYRDWNPKTPESCQDGSYTYTNGCFEMIELPYQIAFWAIPCLMTLVLISACFVCLRNKANGHRRYQSDDEATLIELQQLHYPNPSAPSYSEYRQPLIHQNNPQLYPKLANAPPSYQDVKY